MKKLCVIERILMVMCVVVALLTAAVVGAIIDRVVINHKLEMLITDLKKK